MRTRQLVFGGAASVVLAVVGCGGSSDNGLGTPQNIAIEDVPGLYAAASCQAVEACLGTLFEVFLAGEDCQQRTEAGIADGVSQFKQAIADGKAVYDGTKVQACLDDIKSRGCDALLTHHSDVCDAALDGTTAVGGECDSDIECQGSAHCKSSANQCPGVCTAPEAAGGTCEHDDDCQNGLSCSESNQRCGAPLATGDSCGANIAGECVPGTVCVGGDENQGTPGKCVLIDAAFAAKLGESCDFMTGKLCAPGLSCAVESVTGGVVSWKCVEKLSAGAACKVAIPDACPADEFCMAPPNMIDGTCTPKPGAGQTCGVTPFSTEPSICAPYARCDAGTCKALTTIGGSCKLDETCYTENCVNGSCALGGACE